jgi:hypothetical protein
MISLIDFGSRNLTLSQCKALLKSEIGSRSRKEERWLVVVKDKLGSLQALSLTRTDRLKGPELEVYNPSTPHPRIPILMYKDAN